jgi:hypothetical protein
MLISPNATGVVLGTSNNGIALVVKRTRKDLI